MNREKVSIVKLQWFVNDNQEIRIEIDNNNNNSNS